MNKDYDALLFGDEKEVLKENLVEAATAHREWLRDNDGDYITARENFKDVEWLQTALETFRTIFERIQEFAGGEEPEYKAIFVLGQAERSMASVFSQIAIVSEYEDRKEAIERTRAMLDECLESEDSEK